ncbi:MULTISPECIES: DUF1622 domain-containing protein [Aphanizomenonaceae]|jgi:uncharacterized membrane protein|uniref:DUF1622 domain-containing protein n=1 Tax=Dolichospermum heterosporum TAC447 TaxID=747523 RepID=A0ABY5LYT1_9CYAN|nr:MULTISPECIES: DUF1622 domain-containing protein [Aphanizomenonaceae]MBE9256464.1 DUF1622 domain-containing protein [Dolichospermum sp. LEGE 00246]MDK2412303.1 DUF1622 domain-containing protein [Aphanizomenon sp. 202]MDK2459559.1 DUF1622 domain-containing protein [Aphanizomenon sp. PH219]UUO16430.1 DUF1622 domain-containing protein [Dolichospermum heterosporum TAC447]
MVLFEQLESGLAFFVTLLKFLLELISVFCILLGVLKTGKIAITRNHNYGQNRFLQIRLNFGIWLVLALEFQLGADILSTTYHSTFESLGKLGIVALIRTFLNYFLSQELNKQQ